MTPRLDSLMRIAAGLAVTAFGALMSYGMIEMGRHARWNEASFHDIASYVFSCGVVIAMVIGGVLLTVNPKIRGARVW